MIFSERNSPVFNCVDKNSLGEMPIFEHDQSYFNLYLDSFTENWKYYNQYFKQELNVVSEPFYNASTKASEKLSNLFNDIMQNDKDSFSINGSYLIGDIVYLVHFETKQGSDELEIAFYMFHKRGMPIAFYIESYRTNTLTAWVSNKFDGYFENNAESIKAWIMNYVSTVFIISMFKRYAEVETKIIDAQSKVKDSKDKFINDLKLPVTYLDSRWFTNIVKSDGFMVSGHFRLQPKKFNGEWTKELIWIEEFGKSGYTSTAKVNG